jgi:hypothetical protein
MSNSDPAFAKTAYSVWYLSQVKLAEYWKMNASDAYLLLLKKTFGRTPDSELTMPANLHLTHSKVHELSVSDLEGEDDRFESMLDAIFSRFNDYDTNPLANAASQEKNRAMLVAHTSMSVGDIIEVHKHGGPTEIFICGGVGWQQLAAEHTTRV